MTKEVNGKMSPELSSGIQQFAETGNFNALPTIKEIDGKTALAAIVWTRINVLKEKHARQTTAATHVLDHLAALEENGCQIQVTGSSGQWIAKELRTGLSATGYSMADAIRQLANVVFIDFNRRLPLSEHPLLSPHQKQAAP